MLADEPIDAAVLDVNLGDVMSYPIADRLKGRGIPYMFLTGYDGWSLPDEFRDAARLAKPFPMHTVITMIEALVAAEQECA